MKGYLLDTNLLIALLWPSHEKHDLALKWFTRDAVQPREAIQVLSANTAAKDHAFWPDALPVAEAVTFTGVRLMGHQQVTDAYLLGLAIHRGGMLATLDQRIAALTEPKSAERKALETVA